jgi:succinate dehydrogenase / fumarate reductase, cytochrome b subunit
MARNPGRPLSPHLTIWKWGPHMLVSILHRATGTSMALGGGVLLVWWLLALAGGEASYARFVDIMSADATGRLNWLPLLILVAFTWTFLQHLCSGVRHLLLDTGAGYELKVNKTGAMATLSISVTLTILVWAFVFVRGVH